MFFWIFIFLNGKNKECINNLFEGLYKIIVMIIVSFIFVIIILNGKKYILVNKERNEKYVILFRYRY